MTTYRRTIGPGLGLIAIVLFGACTSGVSTTEPTTTTPSSTSQTTSLRIDDDGNLHLSYATITGTRPLAGEVWYAKGTVSDG